MRNAYRQYLLDIGEAYAQIIRGRELQDSDPEEARKLFAQASMTGSLHLPDEAARAEQELQSLCTIKGVPKGFKIQ